MREHSAICLLLYATFVYCLVILVVLIFPIIRIKLRILYDVGKSSTTAPYLQPSPVILCGLFIGMVFIAAVFW